MNGKLLTGAGGVGRWYAVFCRPRQEMVAVEGLARQGFRAYLPRIRVARRRQGRWVDAVEALFPRYLFIRFDPSRCNISPVRSTRGVVGLVRFGEHPAVIPDDVIDALIRCEDSASGLHRDCHPLFCEGVPVKVLGGLLAGMEGVFSQEDGEGRAIVLLELLGKINKVSVQRDRVVRAN